MENYAYLWEGAEEASLTYIAKRLMEKEGYKVIYSGATPCGIATISVVKGCNEPHRVHFDYNFLREVRSQAKEDYRIHKELCRLT